MVSDGRVRTAVFISGGGTNLQALIDASAQGTMPSVELSLVVSDRPNAGGLARAEEAGIPSAVVVPGEGFNARLAEALTAHRIEIIVLAGYLRHIPNGIVTRFAGRILNVHPSLLPAFGGKGWYGLKVHRGVLERGVKITGATVHVVTEDFDEGPIVAQKAVEVRPDDTPETLQERVKVTAEWQILPQATQDLARAVRAGRKDTL